MVRIIKYRPLSQLPFKTYTPKKRIELDSKKIISPASSLGFKLAQVSGFFLLIASSIILSIKAFFTAKDKVRQIQMKHEKVIDFRKKNNFLYRRRY